MGTRSTTRFIDSNNKTILCLYKQMDGYVGGWGKDLKDFLKSGKFGNGISLAHKGRFFNGFGDFALQLVCEFKDGAGGIYATTDEDEQQYNYTFKEDYDEKTKIITITLTCKEDKKLKTSVKYGGY